jgi:predicted nucleotidyltransferase
MDYKHNRIVYHKFDNFEKNKKLQILKNLLERDKRIKLAYLFGSITRRNRVRDIDIAIYALPILEFEEFLKLGAKLEMELNIPLDLVQIQDLKPAFRYRILRDGKAIIMKDKKLHHILLYQTLSEIHTIQIIKSKFKSKAQHS